MMSRLALALALLAVGASAESSDSTGRSAVLFVADGLGWGHLQLWREVRLLQGRPPRMALLWEKGTVGAASVRPADALVAESAGGASMLATGLDSPNLVLSAGPGGAHPPTIIERALAAGKTAGLVTTGRLTHAVPAAFLVHASRRDPEAALTEDIMHSSAAVLLGGGADAFGELELHQAAGRRVVRTAAELSGAGRGPVLGLFAADYFPYAIDRGAASATPSLEAMTRAALNELSRNARGFVLVVDARLIDESSHNNDAAAMLAELDELDAAVAAVLDSPSGRDILLVLTSPHDTGGPAVVSKANPLDWTAPETLKTILTQKRSFRSMLASLWMTEIAGGRVDASAIRRAARVAVPALAGLDGAALEAVSRAFARGPKVMPFHHSPAAAELARALEGVYRVRWQTGTHTNLPVPLFARGPGAERFAGWLTASEVGARLADALGL